MSYFGTDGIRGRAGEGKLSDDNLARMGRALGAFVGSGGRVVIGRDTRESGPAICAILDAELDRAGVERWHLGVVPTPATALLTQLREADLGIMITASHNPWHDNGVKLFSPSGRKLTDAMQAELDRLITRDLPPKTGTGRRVDEVEALDIYKGQIIDSVGRKDLSKLTLVVDGANGAGHRCLADILEGLGAKVTRLDVDPDGRNINAGVGSTAPAACRAAVLEHGADAGFALDGDADRILAVDAKGVVADGDQIVARLALDARAAGTFKGDAIVSTVMANLGLELWAASEGLTLHRTKVGDRHVAARMAQIGANIGGEPSGHILLTDVSTTGDGTLTAVMLAAALSETNGAVDDFFTVFEPVPQLLKNARYDGDVPLSRPDVKAVIAQQEAALAGCGRVLVRASGTEPVIRVMAEGTNPSIVAQAVDKIVLAIETPA